MTGRASPEHISLKEHRIAELAKLSTGKAMTSLSHFIDIDWLKEAYRRTRRDGAPGVDGQTADEYGENLEENLQSLLDRAKSGLYRAPPVKRVYIPKGDGSETRPIGIPTFEDKVLQRAVVMVLEPVYEQEFYDVSYGFRPGRSAHGALEAFWSQMIRFGGGWVVEVDIRKFFDALDHARLREVLRQRVRDGVLLRLIGKWLHAGVLEDGAITRPQSGTPQGGVISPLLANIYLHVVLDEWFAKMVQPRLRGRGFLVRYADDFIIGLTREHDAHRVMDVLPKRFGKYGLTLHPDKTRLVRFRPNPPDDGPDGPPTTFDFLGFTHFWGRSRKGRWVVKRKTASKRLSRALKSVRRWCWKAMHWPVREQHEALCRKMKGHFAYYGITGNSKSLSRFAQEVNRIWLKALRRRNNRHHKNSWEWFNKLLVSYPLPQPIAVHSKLRLRANP